MDFGTAEQLQKFMGFIVQVRSVERDAGTGDMRSSLDALNGPIVTSAQHRSYNEGLSMNNVSIYCCTDSPKFLQKYSLLPLFTTKLINKDKIQQEICSHSHLIVTSKRAAQAISHIPPDVTIYTVGISTASYLPPGCTTTGNTGNARSLADFIIADNPPKLLFLTGDKRLGTLPTLIRGAGIQLAELCVYETSPDSSVPSKLRDIVRVIGTVVLVMFSPSGVDFIVECLKSIECLAQVKWASIGPTTSERMRKLDLDVWVEASSPDLEGLNHALHYATLKTS